MELKTIVSKRAYLFSLIYDLFHVPSLQENDHLYVYNMGDFSKALYIGYMLERYGLWMQAVQEIIGVDGSGEVEKYIKILDSIDVFRWELIEEELRILANKTVKIYNEYKDKIIREVSRILGIGKYYERIYLLMGFNPMKGTYGSLLYVKDPEYAVVSVMTSPDIDAAKVVDLLLHEVLHGFIRTNNVPIPDEIEEEFIDTLCPDGYLSNLLGLSSDLVVGKGQLQHIIRDYFDQKLYDRGIKLPDYIRQTVNGQYHI